MHDKHVVLVPDVHVAQPVEHAKQAFPPLKYFPLTHVRHDVLVPDEHVKQLASHSLASKIHCAIPYFCPAGSFDEIVNGI